MTPVQRAAIIEQLGRQAGFARVGIAVARALDRADDIREWLDRGRHGQMAYLERMHQLRIDPARLLDGARSIIVVADNYHHGDPPGEPAATDPDRGRIARYAWGRDYHRVLRKKLFRVCDDLRTALGEPFDARVCVDTAPIVEREAAAAAGIGWIGKNTMVLHHEIGSFFFLGEIITTLEIAPSRPVADRCGSCTRCLDACPTAALIAPYRMDATRCIAYLTIEHRTEVPADLQPHMGNWIFGCDVCQNVCPYNRNPLSSADDAYAPRDAAHLPPSPPLQEILQWNDDDYRRHLAGSAVKRATLPMLQRNARIASLSIARQRKEGDPAS